MRNMLRCMLIPFLCLLGLFCSLQAQDAPILKIAALHPVLGDMARSIGGSRVQVADLLRPRPQRPPLVAHPGQYETRRPHPGRNAHAAGPGP